MSSLIKLTRTIHFLEQFIIYNACMYLCMYTNIIWLHMIMARIRWCTCRVENILTLGKLLSLWFCFLLHSILFLISQTSYRTYQIISSYELARPIMGTIFLVIFNFKILSLSVQIRYLHDLRANADKIISIGSYSPEVCVLGILIMSTKVVRLIICKNYLTAPPKRSFT